MLTNYRIRSSFSSLSLVKWDTTGIAVYFFPRGSVPADISAGAPQPDSWGLALARWPAASCAPFQFFNNHQAIFDTTLWCIMLFDQSNALTLSSFVVVIGQGLYGVSLVSRVKNGAALRLQGSRHVKLLYEQTDLR